MWINLNSIIQRFGTALRISVGKETPINIYSKEQVDGLITTGSTDVTNLLGNKVDKVTNKSLIANTEIARLAAISGANTGDETGASIINKIGDGTKINQSYLPSYVDDVIEAANLTAIQALTGEAGKIYIALDSGKQYRWGGTVYIQITNGLIATTNDLPEGSANLYFTVARTIAATLTSYVKAVTSRAITSADSIWTAITILEKKADDNATNINTNTGLVTANTSRLSTMSTGSNIGDANYFDDVLLLFCGDSTTWQMTALQSGFDWLTSFMRKPGQPMEKVKGYINFGSSGYKLKDFVENPAVAPPVINETSNLGIGSWDFFGHNVQIAVSLNTVLAYRAARTEKIIWRIGFGVNDVLLDSSIGNLTQQQITDYIFGHLQTAVLRIRATHKEDIIVLKTPNPMYARPYNTAFPQQAQYPSFGTDAVADAVLVNKWNVAIRNGYIKAKGLFSKTILLDTHDRVYGYQDASTPSTTLPFMSDSVHPHSSGGYLGEMDELISFFTPPKEKNLYQKKRAEGQALTNGGNPWDYYPNYFEDNDKLRRIYSLTGLTIGTNYIDIPTPVGAWDLAAQGRPVYIYIENVGAQKFTTYTDVANGAVTTRLLNVTPISKLVGAIGKVVIFVDRVDAPTQDTYIVTQLMSIKPKEVFYGRIVNAGSGFIDIAFNQVQGRFSTKYIINANRGTLIIGGSVATNITDLNTWSPNRFGTVSNRSVRYLKTGSWGSYINSEIALVYDDSVPSPRAFEGVTDKLAAMSHSQNNVTRVITDITCIDGVNLSCALTEVAGVQVTINVHSCLFPNRTLVGTCTIPFNNGNSNVLAVTSSVNANTVFEFTITSATSQATGLVVCKVSPL